VNLRRRKELRPDAKDRYYREIGWKPNGSGTKLIQHRFYLGKDRHEAEIRIRLLEKLWKSIEAQNGNGKSSWNERTLDIAKAIARGDTSYAVPRNAEWDGDIDGLYAHQVRTLARTFAAVITIVPEDTDGFENGRQEELELASRIQTIADNTRARVGASIVGGDGATLHHALNAYVQWIESEFLAPAENGEERTLTAWGRAQLRNVERLKERHENIPLDCLKQSEVEGMIRLWRQRPMVKGKESPIKVKTAKHHIKQLRSFFRWLHRSQDFDWQLPDGFHDIKATVATTRKEQVARYTPIQAETYDLDELLLLNQYATPNERLLLLVGLNCGAGNSELANLLLSEIVLRERHPYAKILHFESSVEDSFIKGPRPKTGVYGEFLLWPQTIQVVEWAIERRQRQTRISAGPLAGKDITATPDSHLILTEQGYPLTRLTQGGNRNQRLPNIWSGLLRRVRKDHGDFRLLSFGKIRKTAGNLVKQFSDGEIAGVFLRHGNVVKTDDLIDLYTNRPFGKVFEALRRVERYLQPMFDSIPSEPFPAERKKGGPNITPGQIRQIRSLRKQGFKIKKIAELVGVTTQTVHRHLKKK